MYAHIVTQTRAHSFHMLKHTNICTAHKTRTNKHHTQNTSVQTYTSPRAHPQMQKLAQTHPHSRALTSTHTCMQAHTLVCACWPG